MATQQDAEVFGFDAQDFPYSNPNFANTQNSHSYGGGAPNRMQLFDEMARGDQNSVSALTNPYQWQEMQQASRFSVPFRPLDPNTGMNNSSIINFRDGYGSLGSSFDSMNTSIGGSSGSSWDNTGTPFTGTDNMQPLKIDTSMAPSINPVAIQGVTVDVNKYETVPDAEWWVGTDWASSCRSSVRTESTGPQTPVSPHTAHEPYLGTGYQGSSDLDVVSKVDGTGSDMFPLTTQGLVSASCQCINCNSPVAPHQLTNVWSAEQPQTSFTGPLPMYGPGASSVTGLPVTQANHSQQVNVPIVPRQTSTSATSSVMDVERQGSETGSEESDDSDWDTEELNVNHQAINDATHRQKRDRFLLKMRSKGRSYKDIKELGKFAEAESTLRGRVRVLTKDKSVRVRKPEWEPKDVSLSRNIPFISCFDHG